MGRSINRQLAEILSLERQEHTRHRRRYALPLIRPGNTHPANRTPHHLQAGRTSIDEEVLGRRRRLTRV